jgi:hypothetical protein
MSLNTNYNKQKHKAERMAAPNTILKSTLNNDDLSQKMWANPERLVVTTAFDVY